MIQVVSSLTVSVLCTYPSGKVAVRRGYAGKAWYWMGALFGPIALIAVFLPHSRRGQRA